MVDVRVQKKIAKGHHPSSAKRHRQSLKRQARNRRVKSRLKTAIKKVRGNIKLNKGETISAQLREVTSLLHKAASKGVIPKRRASRLSSRLAKAANVPA